MSSQQQWLLSISGYCFLIAVIAKSAQFPLHIWLPDAMEGPTPISALIHAATMVIAGIYLLIRLQFLLSIDVHNTMIIIGSFTCFMAAFIALKQYDLKKILAYSTISQLGYMLSAIGAASETAAFNHLYAHAFYKASLFLSAGSIIHFLHHQYHYKNDKDVQDIRNAKGLIKHLPITFIAFTFSAASLIGIPLFSGSFSKDSVILEVFDFSIYQGSVLLETFAVLNLATVFLTALYMFRLYWYLFLRDKIAEATAVAESKIFKLVLLILLPFSIINISAIKNTAHTGFVASNIYYILIALFGIAFFIIYTYYKKVRTTNNFIFKLSANELYIDWFYQKLIVKAVMMFANAVKFFDKVIVDGIVNQSANLTIFISKIADGIDRYVVDALVNNIALLARRIGDLIRAFQTGKVQSYFALSVFILFIIILILKA
jgi:NADH-quinone oxidoreductase subunit L